MTIYLGLGSNLGDRLEHLNQGIRLLQDAGFTLEAVSPLVESPAMLPEDAPHEWAKPFLNLVVGGQADWSPQQGLEAAKRIEESLGRDLTGPRWSPRPIDIDLLIWDEEVVSSEALTVPHVGLRDRPFALTPLLHLNPNLVIPGTGETVFEASRKQENIPLWMGIVNITPDSFSDGNSWFDREALGEHLDKLIERNVHIIDIGAESTRPNAETVDAATEWQRLSPVLDQVFERLDGLTIRPRVSVDSRHPASIARALERGIDLINDVTGLDDPEMLAVVRECECDVVAMHAMTVPVDPAVRLPADRPAVPQISEWIERKAESWTAGGIDLGRMIVDPGIGFGKSPLQAYQIMSSIDQLRSHGMRLLVGHSRKSFMSAFSDRPAGQRDLETLGISMRLWEQGTDIIRVHQPFIHQRAYRAWSQIRDPVLPGNP